MKFIEKFKLKRKIKKSEKKLYFKIFDEIFEPKTDINGLIRDFHGTKDIKEFNSKKIITTEWTFGGKLGEIISVEREYKSKFMLSNDTYNELMTLDRLRKYFNLTY